ncbi:hypothetical protein ACJIZ3_017633 [Penstemon smallii]|uniref:RRM domain-containing protein n=1 Tax=Penstemon smallii TaxID=265156 RepID=A0ABD3SW29_9LAMI
MALFCNTQNLFSTLQRNHAAQKPFLPRTSNFTTLKFEFVRPSVFAPVKFIDAVILNHKCCSSLSSSDELEKGPLSTSIIFIKGLAQSTSEKGVKMAFSQIGEVSRVKLVYDKKTKQPLGFAYVWFTREEHAHTAVEVMNFFDGKFIYVTIAKPGSCKPRPKPTPYKF